MRRLNLGCGNEPLTGPEDVNHDIVRHRPEITVTHDLNELPWPWPDEAFDGIVAKAVLEHLDHDLVLSLNECWRLLRPGGWLFVKLPHWKSDVSYWDPTHRWMFSLRSLDRFDPETAEGGKYAFCFSTSAGAGRVPWRIRPWRIVEPAILNPSGSSIAAKLEVRK